MGIVNFSAIGRRTILGRALRAPLRLIPAGASVRVLQGPLRGAKWIVGSSNHGCWLGSYEREKQLLFTQIVRPGMVVFDVGANVGFYTLLASRLVGPAGRVIAFEPAPRNVEYLRRHVAGNQCNNVQILPVAAAESKGVARFSECAGPSEGSLSEEGALIVETDTIDELVGAGRIPFPDLVKIDVEGAERRVLEGARGVLEAHPPVILLATHGDRVRAECLELLERIGYRVRALDGSDTADADEFSAVPS